MTAAVERGKWEGRRKREKGREKKGGEISKQLFYFSAASKDE